MMAVEGPYVAAVIARLADPTLNLAAYGVAFSFAFIAEAPIIMVMTASNALVRDRASHLRMRRFVYALNTFLTGAVLVGVFPPLFRFVTERAIGLPAEVARLTHIATALLVLWPAAIGYRRFYQGILVRHNMPRRVAYGTVIRMVSMSVTAMGLAWAAPIPGACLGALALMSGVLCEAAASRWMARHVVADLLRGAPPQAAESPRRPWNRRPAGDARGARPADDLWDRRPAGNACGARPADDLWDRRPAGDACGARPADDLWDRRPAGNACGARPADDLWDRRPAGDACGARPADDLWDRRPAGNACGARPADDLWDRRPAGHEEADEPLSADLVEGGAPVETAVAPEATATGPSLTTRDIIAFYYPLALTSLLAIGINPLVTFFLGRSRFALDSLAVLPVITGLVFVFRSGAIAYQEVAVALIGPDRQHERPVARVGLWLAGAAALCLAAMLFTPLADDYFVHVAGLPPALAHFAVWPARALAFVPVLDYLLTFQRARLILARQTRLITVAAAIESATVAAGLVVGIGAFDVVGALCATCALFAGRLAGNLALLTPRASAVVAQERPPV
jgi:hypothetical protein